MGPVKPTCSLRVPQKVFSRYGRNKIFYVSVFARAPYSPCGLQEGNMAEEDDSRASSASIHQRFATRNPNKSHQDLQQRPQTFLLRTYQLLRGVLPLLPPTNPRLEAFQCCLEQWFLYIFCKCRNRIAGEAVGILPQEQARLLGMKTEGCASESPPLGPPVASSSARRL